MSEQPIAPEITQDDKLWALLAYLFPIIAIIILLMEDKKNRPFLKFHAVQSLAVTVVLTILATVTLGCGSILFLVMIYWGIKAYQGEYVTIPVVTDFIKKQGWV
ncbi:MAG: hypothetical protein ABWK53_02665 [Anaerolineales bacterium]